MYGCKRVGCDKAGGWLDRWVVLRCGDRWDVALFFEDLDIAAEAFVEGDESFGAFDPFYFLQFVVEDKAQLVDVFAGYFGEHAIVTGGVVEADDLGDLLE